MATNITRMAQHIKLQHPSVLKPGPALDGEDGPGPGAEAADTAGEDECEQGLLPEPVPAWNKNRLTIDGSTA